MGTKVKMKYFVLLTFLLASAHCLPTKNSKSENIQTEPEYNDENPGKDFDQNQYTEDSVEINDYQQSDDENNVNEDQNENSEENLNYSQYESEDLEAEQSDEVFKANNEKDWIDYNDKVEEEVEESNQEEDRKDDPEDFVQASEKPVILNESEWVDYDENNKYIKDENKIVLSKGDEVLDNNGIYVKTIP